MITINDCMEQSLVTTANVEVHRKLYICKQRGWEFRYIYRGDVDIVGGTGKGSSTVKLHSEDSLEHLIQNGCTALCNVVCLFVCLSCWVNCDKFVFRKESHDMYQALAE